MLTDRQRAFLRDAANYWHRGPHQIFTDEDRDLVEALFRAMRLEATERVVAALVTGMECRERYLTDATFHYSLRLIAEVAAKATLGEIVLTDDEVEARRLAYETITVDFPTERTR